MKPLIIGLSLTLAIAGFTILTGASSRSADPALSESRVGSHCPSGSVCTHVYRTERTSFHEQLRIWQLATSRQLAQIERGVLSAAGYPNPGF